MIQITKNSIYYKAEKYFLSSNVIKTVKKLQYKLLI